MLLKGNFEQYKILLKKGFESGKKFLTPNYKILKEDSDKAKETIKKAREEEKILNKIIENEIYTLKKDIKKTLNKDLNKNIDFDNIYNAITKVIKKKYNR